MDKAQALQHFWESFGIPAYNELTVPEGEEMPYITYEVGLDSLGYPVALSASIYYHQFSWSGVYQKAAEVAEAIEHQNPPGIKIDGGRLYISRAEPFVRPQPDESDRHIRRLVLNITAEFLTAY